MREALLPPRLISTLEELLSARVTGAVALSGGQVSSAARVATTNGRFFVKWEVGVADAGRFVCEADGLERLREVGTLRIPQVLGTQYLAATGTEPAVDFLALEYLTPQSPTDVTAFSRRFANGLAELHRATASDRTYGLTIDNWLGSQPQKNTPPLTDWTTFYRQYRLLPQIERARQANLLASHRERLLAEVLERLPVLLVNMPLEASLIHGDLWSGNFLCTAKNEPVLIDPAVYFAPREMELAYIELFGGFPRSFVQHYHNAFPLDEGYERRRQIHLLYPLLIHLNHFGERYGAALDKACRQAMQAKTYD